MSDYAKKVRGRKQNQDNSYIRGCKEKEDYMRQKKKQESGGDVRLTDTDEEKKRRTVEL